MPSRKEKRSEEALAYRALYNDKRWLDRREEQLEREPYCAMCRQEGKTKLATIADHVNPHRGDPIQFFDGLLQSLCWYHHSSTKQRQERSGVLVGFDKNGAALDPNSPWNSDTYEPSSKPPVV